MKYQSADPLTVLATNGEDTSPLEDDIPLLPNDTRHPENTPTNNYNVGSPQSFQPPTVMEFSRGQASETCYRMGHSQVDYTNSKLNFNADSLLIRRFGVNEALHILVPPSLG